MFGRFLVASFLTEFGLLMIYQWYHLQQMLEKFWIWPAQFQMLWTSTSHVITTFIWFSRTDSSCLLSHCNVPDVAQVCQPILVFVPIVVKMSTNATNAGMHLTFSWIFASLIVHSNCFNFRCYFLVYGFYVVLFLHQYTLVAISNSFQSSFPMSFSCSLSLTRVYLIVNSSESLFSNLLV